MTMTNISTSGGLRMNLNVSGTKRKEDPKQRPDRFSSVRALNYITPTFEHV